MLRGSPFLLVSKGLHFDRLRIVMIASVVIAISASSVTLHSHFSDGGFLPSLVSFAFIVLPLFLMAVEFTGRRTHNLYVFKTLGARRATVAKLLLVELSVVALAGAAVGCLIGVALLSASPSTPVDLTSEAVLPLTSSAIAAVVGVAVGVMTGVRLAWKP